MLEQLSLHVNSSPLSCIVGSFITEKNLSHVNIGLPFNSKNSFSYYLQCYKKDVDVFDTKHYSIKDRGEFVCTENCLNQLFSLNDTQSMSY